MTPSTKRFMDDFWSAGFLPVPFQLTRSVSWFWDRWVQIYADQFLMRYSWPWLFVLLAPLGLFALWQRRRYHALVLIGPLTMAVLAAIAHQYPLHSRVALYVLPILILAASAGAEQLRLLLSRRSSSLGAVTIAVCLIPPVLAAVRNPPPYVVENHRALLSYLQQHRRPGDSVYVIANAHSPVIYYGPKYGLRRDDWRLSVCDRDSVRPLLRDLDRYRGVPRLWVISMGVIRLRATRDAMQRYLGTIGTRRDSLFVPSSVFGPLGLELYDLSDSARLRAAAVDTLRLPPIPAPKPGCRDWSGAVRASVP